VPNGPHNVVFEAHVSVEVIGVGSQRIREGLTPLVLYVGDQDLAPLLDEEPCRGLSDAARAPCDQGDSALKLSRYDTPLLFPIVSGCF
jgi:hypothetical protein